MTGARPEVVTGPDADATAADGADRLFGALAAAQADRGVASVVLTGGGIGIAMLRAVAASPRRDEVDWRAVEIFWGDERFVPAGSEDRNDVQARDALLDHLDVDPARVHPMAASDAAFGGRRDTQRSGAGPLNVDGDPDAGADTYARVLSDAAARLDPAGPGGETGVPPFDVLLAGCGPEGHTLSIFPDSPAAHVGDVGVVAVRDCPKPPPMRLSLTLPAARRAREVWLVAAGEGKADALARAYEGATEIEIPLAGLTGAERTLWLLDQAAAARLPR